MRNPNSKPTVPVEKKVVFAMLGKLLGESNQNLDIISREIEVRFESMDEVEEGIYVRLCEETRKAVIARTAAQRVFTEGDFYVSYFFKNRLVTVNSKLPLPKGAVYFDNGRDFCPKIAK